MKLPELKKKFTKKYVIRIIAGVLVVGMVGTGVSTANVFAAKTAQESRMRMSFGLVFFESFAPSWAPMLAPIPSEIAGSHTI